MSTHIQLIVGLGNPGSEYERTRHNAGFWCIDHIAKHYNIGLNAEKKYHGWVGKGTIEGQTRWLLKPATFMNKSGVAVASLANFFKIPAHDILIMHDELDLPPGIARYKQGGGHGGQNGLRDTIQALGNQKDFHRLRIGIGHPGDKHRVTSHVLGKASNSDQTAIDRAIQEALGTLPDALNNNMPKAMNRLHSFSA